MGPTALAPPLGVALLRASGVRRPASLSVLRGAQKGFRPRPLPPLCRVSSASSSLLAHKMAAPDLERLLAELLEPDSDVIRRVTDPSPGGRGGGG